MTTVFYLFGLTLLIFMAYILWAGVGRKRPVIARGFAIVVLAVAAYVLWLLVDL